MRDEVARLAALHRLGVLDAEPDLELDELVVLLARALDAESASVSLVDADRQWFGASTGITGTETPRGVAFCDHTIRQDRVLVVEDARDDPRFADNPLVTGAPFIRSYAGAPLVTRDGAAVGAVCVFDPRVRGIGPYEQAILETVARQVVDRLEVRSALLRAARDPQTGEGPQTAPGTDAVPPQRGPSWGHDEHLRSLVEHGTTGYVETDDDGIVCFVNEAAARMLGYARAELVGRPVRELAHPAHVADQDAAVARLEAAGRTSYEATRMFCHRDGRAVQVRCSVSRRAAPGSAATAALLTDLSGQVSAAAHRVSAEQARQRVLETASDAYVSIDQDGTVTEWNAAAERLFGHPRREAVGRSLVDLIVPAELVAAHLAGIRRLVAGGEPALTGHALELPALHRDGSALQIELTPWMDTLADGSRRFHAFCRDIGGRLAARAALEESHRLLRAREAQLRAAFDASPTADALLAEDGSFVQANPAMCRLLGVTPATLVGARLHDVVHGQDRTLVASAWATVAVGGAGVPRLEVRFLRGRLDEDEDSRVVWGLTSLLPMDTDVGGPRGMVRIESLQAHKELESAFALQASHDQVSGLPNRSLLVERVRQALEARQDGPSVAAVVLDVHGLPAVIDRHGFPAGDRLLAVVAQRLRDRTPPDVTLAHLRPGRFAAVVPGGAEAAARLAEEYLHTFSPVAHRPAEVALDAVVGIADASETRASPVPVRVARLVQDAEAACRVARSDGHEAVVFAAPELRAAQQRRQDLEAMIRGAMADGRVKVAYQPVYDLTTGGLTGVEALLRVQDPTGRPVPPLEIVPVAEASGLIVGIGRLVLREATAQVARWWRDHGVLLPVAVNVSAVQLARGTFGADVLGAVTEAGIPPEALTLELTESVLLASGSVGVGLLDELRAAGVGLAIDDFGTGYASLSYLRDLPATTLKIDRSFVEGIPDDHGAMAIVAGVIGLAKNFGLTCIAEGVETQSQLDYLAGRGILGQGYLLGRPADSEAISALLSGDSAGGPVHARASSAADERDDDGDRRDLAGDRRDLAGDRRDQAGDERDTVGDRRDKVADRRDRAGDERDVAADDRDSAADARDHAGALRDTAAAQRDHVAERAETGRATDDDPAVSRERTRLARLDASADRAGAEQDRRAGAEGRAQALADRRVASDDRLAGATERLGSEVDRNIAHADRGSGAGDRLSAGGDRRVSHGDRGASADDRQQPGTDHLTHVYTRSAGLVELSRELTRCAREGHDLLLVMVEVDGVDGVAEAVRPSGGAAADDLMRAASVAVRAGLRSYDLVLRYDDRTLACALTMLDLAAASDRLLLVSAAMAGGDPRGSLTFGAARLDPDDTADTLTARAQADLVRRRERGLAAPELSVDG